MNSPSRRLIPPGLPADERSVGNIERSVDVGAGVIARRDGGLDRLSRYGGVGRLHGASSTNEVRGGTRMIVLRREIGDVLRDARQRQGRTLREVSSAARVSLGYLSEVERGQKEASSELLHSICDALDVPMSVILREVSDRVAVAEGVFIPDTVPVELTGMVSPHRDDQLPHVLARIG